MALRLRRRDESRLRRRSMRWWGKVLCSSTRCQSSWSPEAPSLWDWVQMRPPEFPVRLRGRMLRRGCCPPQLLPAGQEDRPRWLAVGFLMRLGSSPIPLGPILPVPLILFELRAVGQPQRQRWIGKALSLRRGSQWRPRRRRFLQLEVLGSKARNCQGRLKGRGPGHSRSPP